jgi:hypothetical protein
MFLRTLKQVNMSSEMGENETALRCFLTDSLREIQAPVELTAFFVGWNIRVVSEYDSDEDVELGEKSVVHARKRSHRNSAAAGHVDDVA